MSDTQQLGLFAPAPRGALRPLARHSDPRTSRDAARALERSGALGEQAERALSLLRAYLAAHGDAPTTGELAGPQTSTEAMALYRMLGRRLADLRELGHVRQGEARVCRVTGRRAITWTISTNGGEG